MTRRPYDRVVGSRTLHRVVLHLSGHTGFKPPQQGRRGFQCSCERGGGEKEVKVHQSVLTVRHHTHCSGDSWSCRTESRRWIFSRNWDAASPAQLLQPRSFSFLMQRQWTMTLPYCSFYSASVLLAMPSAILARTILSVRHVPVLCPEE